MTTQVNSTVLGTLGNLTVTNDVRIGGNTLFTNGGYSTLSLGPSDSGGGRIQFLWNGGLNSNGTPRIYNAGNNLIILSGTGSGGDPKIILGLSSVNKSIEITSANVDLVSGNVRVSGNLTVTDNISANVAGFPIGYRDLPQVTAGNVTLALTDAGKHYYSTSGAPQTITVPSNANVAFPLGTTIVIINRGLGNISVSKQVEVGMYLAGNSTSATRTLTSYGMATLVKTETNVWFINGAGVA
jgi:hypothetical protein